MLSIFPGFSQIIYPKSAHPGVQLVQLDNTAYNPFLAIYLNLIIPQFWLKPNFPDPYLRMGFSPFQLIFFDEY